MINELSDRIDSLCEYVDMGQLKGDNSKEESYKIGQILDYGNFSHLGFKI